MTKTFDVELRVVDINEPPTLASAPTLSIDENLPSGTYLYTIEIWDDFDQQYTFVIVDGDEMDLTGVQYLTVNYTTGQLYIDTSPDFEAFSEPVFPLLVNVTDNDPDNPKWAVLSIEITIVDCECNWVGSSSSPWLMASLGVSCSE